MRRRDNRIVENVDFEKLRKCLKKHGITQKELSIVSGYYPEYIEKNTLRKHYLTQHVRDVLTYAYKIDPSEYIDTQPKEAISTVNAQLKEVANTEDDDIYKCAFSCNGDFLKKLALVSIKEHMSIEDFVFVCISKGIKDLQS